MKNNSALHYACQFNHIRAVEVLLARKSLKINVKNIENKLPQDLTKSNTIKSLFERKENNNENNN